MLLFFCWYHVVTFARSHDICHVVTSLAKMVAKHMVASILMSSPAKVATNHISVQGELNPNPSQGTDPYGTRHLPGSSRARYTLYCRKTLQLVWMDTVGDGTCGLHRQK